MSATMLCAHKAGIPVFATGGIGGVHRGGESCKCSSVGSTGEGSHVSAHRWCPQGRGVM